MGCTRLRFTVAIVLLLAPLSYPQETRKPERGVEPVSSLTDEPPAGRRLFVAIAIDKYKSWPTLDNAVSDAIGASESFQKIFRFKQIEPPLLDQAASKAAILELIEDRLRHQLKDNDDLILFFAGHGTTRVDMIGGRPVETGYLVPAEARAPGQDERWSDYIQVDPLLESVGKLPARHILVILDACHSGFALGSAMAQYRGSSRFQPSLTTKVSRRVITSARRNELASDSGPLPGHSLFTGILINGLEAGAVDLYGNGIVTSSDLGNYLEQAVGQYSGSQQVPDFGSFYLDDRGEMVLNIAEKGSDGSSSILPLSTPNVLSSTDTVVLADFDNKTGDPIFDDTLRQALSIQLEQSPFLSLLSDERIQENLRFMDQPADAKLTPEIARDLCQRTGGKAYLSGSIANLGNQYVLGLKAVNCLTGDTLAEEQERATGKEQVLSAMDKAAPELRAKLGESQSTVQKFNTPLQQATTPSLEALKTYTMGTQMFGGKGEHAAAVAYFQRAITLDRNFAMAYAVLGTIYSVLGETSLSMQNAKKAYELRESVSERERFYIETHYYDYVTEDIEKSRRVYELWAQTYPRDEKPRNNLGGIYMALGRYDQSFLEFHENLRLAPETAIPYFNLMWSCLALGHLEEARETFEQARAKNLDSMWLRIFRYQLAFLQNDATGMEEQVTWSLGKPGLEDMFLNLEGDTAAYFGRIRKARDFFHRAVGSARRAENKERAATHEADTALLESLFGNTAEARYGATASMRRSTGPNVVYKAALALAFAGDVAGAKQLATDLGRQYPENINVQGQRVPTIQALLALDVHDAGKAIELLQSAPNEEGDFFQVYVRGVAYEAAHRILEAETEFQRILNRPGVVVNNPIGVLAHLGLARAYTMQGEAAKAKAAYQEFFTLWKDADPNIPVLQQAKAEYAKLQ
jgi:tetratricopeptide (TPR) repeat protein